MRPMSQTFSMSWQGQGPSLLCQDVSSVCITEKQAEVCEFPPPETGVRTWALFLLAVRPYLVSQSET